MIPICALHTLGCGVICCNVINVVRPTLKEKLTHSSPEAINYH